VITLFSASLGDFTYDDFEEMKGFDKYLGIFFLTSYLIVSMVTLLNFLIAILSNTYSYLTEQKNAMYLKEIIILRQKYRYDKRYSAMVSAFVPANILMIMLNPLLLALKSVKMNHVCLICEYILFGLASVILYFVLCLVLSPLTYLVVVLNKTKYLLQKPIFGNRDMLLRVADLIAFIFIGLFWLLIVVIWDTILYAINLFSEDIKSLQEDESMIIARNNAHNDGSIDYPKYMEFISNHHHSKKKKTEIHEFKQNHVNRIRKKITGNVSNPVGEGL